MRNRTKPEGTSVTSTPSFPDQQESSPSTSTSTSPTPEKPSFDLSQLTIDNPRLKKLLDSPVIKPFVNTPKVKALDKLLTKATDEVSQFVDQYDQYTSNLTPKQKSFAKAYWRSFPGANLIPFDKINLDDQDTDQPYQRFVIKQDKAFSYEIDNKGIRHARRISDLPAVSLAEKAAADGFIVEGYKFKPNIDSKFFKEYTKELNKQRREEIFKDQPFNKKEIAEQLGVRVDDPDNWFENFWQ